MILVWLIAIPLAGGVLAWVAARRNAAAARWICTGATLLGLVLTVGLWAGSFGQGGQAPLAEISTPWIPHFGIHFHLAMDGLSLLLVALTFLIGFLAVLCSWSEIQDAVGFFHFNLMWILAGIVGVFLAYDLFLFYFAWELMLIPMYFLIAIWGHERRTYAAVKFFIFTQLGGLLMLVAILALYFMHHAQTGVYTFDYPALLGTSLDANTSWWLMLGFFVAFAVKLPMVPLHTWLPDAHTEAPTAGSVILAGLLLKTGAYGLFRFVIPLFPDASREFAPFAMTLGVVGILYGAIQAFAQTDFKRLIAYSSVSHLGFVLLGIYAWNDLAWQGALMQVICHGISTGALFVVAGALQERMHTRELSRMSGLWSSAPYLSASALFLAMASVGLPGLGNFIAEFLTLLGVYRVDVPLAVAATIGIVAATIYGLKLVQQAFHGPNVNEWQIADLRPREAVIMAVAVVGLIWLGLYPQPVLETFSPAMQTLMQHGGGTTMQALQ